MTVPDASTGREYKRGDAGPDRRPAIRAARCQAATSSTTRSASRRLAANERTCSELRSSQCASSATTRTGRLHPRAVRSCPRPARRSGGRYAEVKSPVGYRPSLHGVRVIAGGVTTRVCLQ